jgi:uncharacterized protein (DUF697 family)
MFGAGDGAVARRRSRGGLSPLAVLSAVRGARSAAQEGPIVVGGPPSLVAVLARELRAGGDASAVREGTAGEWAERASALVWIGEPDEEVLLAAASKRLPIIAVTDAVHVPYVLDTDLVPLAAGRGFPVEKIAVALARRLDDHGPPLAALLPVLREPVVDDLIRSTARRNGVIAAGVFLPAVDMPILTISQIRLVMRIAVAYGHEIDRSRAAEVLGVVGAGFGFRAFARRALTLVPTAGWALKGGVAFAGTTAVGEAARRVYAQQS